MPNTYIALIGDMIGSRDVADFATALAALEAALQEVGRAFPAHIAARPLVTLGDEFQGLFHSWEPLPAVLRLVDERMHPHRFRYGLACGPITSGPIAEVALGMYGPCFTDARRALERAKAEDLPMALEGAGALGDLVESQALLLEAVKRRWTDTMRETVALKRVHGNQRKVARVLGRSPSAVSESLKAAAWPAVERGEGAMDLAFTLLDDAREG